jgi:hypothetical protein
MVTTRKNLEDQVREIRKLIDDAKDTLAQAQWALKTLEARLHEEPEDD